MTFMLLSLEDYEWFCTNLFALSLITLNNVCIKSSNEGAHLLLYKLSFSSFFMIEHYL